MGMPSKMHRIDGGRVSKGMIVSTQRVPESFLCALDPLLLVNPLPNHIFLPDFFPFLLSTENINGVGITDRVAKNSFFLVWWFVDYTWAACWVPGPQLH